jgi:hypothetical protein
VVSWHSGSLLVLGQATGNTDSLDSPRLGLEGSHHLPSYSILCVTPPHLHPNGSFSRDSWSGVPKLSQFGLPGLWELITPSSDLWLGRGLNQTCSPPQELSNGVLHSTCTCRGRVNSRLLVVESQIASLTPGLSFDHNLCCRCPNGSCKDILDIYTSKPFQWYKEHLKAKCFDPCNRTLNFQESQRTLKSHFRECEWRLHTSLKVGLWQITTCMEFCKQIHCWQWWSFYFPWWSCVLKEIKFFLESTGYEIHSKWIVINTLPQMNNEIKGKLVIPIFIYFYITFHFKQSFFIKFFHSPPCRLE